MRASTTVRRRILRWERDGPRPDQATRRRRAVDELAAEEPLEIQIDTRPIVVTMRTPGHDDELAAGFLLSEGLIREPADIVRIRPHPRNKTGNVIQVFLAPHVRVDFAQLTRHVYASSSCGLCGKATIASVHHRFKKLRDTRSFGVAPAALIEAAGRLQQGQTVFGRTGGLHAAAVGTADGSLVVVREDIGRHNAVDKVIGNGLLQGSLPFDRQFLLVSGRASFEILQKALSARFPIVAAISAPSSLAVQFAAESGITLVGFLRSNRLNIYSHPGRVRE